jgi:threonine synthase
MDIALTCYACGEEATLADGPRCDCGEPRWIDTDPAGFDWPARDDRSLWRFEGRRPVSPPAREGRRSCAHPGWTTTSTRAST